MQSREATGAHITVTSVLTVPPPLSGDTAAPSPLKAAGNIDWTYCSAIWRKRSSFIPDFGNISSISAVAHCSWPFLAAFLRRSSSRSRCSRRSFIFFSAAFLKRSKSSSLCRRDIFRFPLRMNALILRMTAAASAGSSTCHIYRQSVLLPPKYPWRWPAASYCCCGNNCNECCSSPFYFLHSKT